MFKNLYNTSYTYAMDVLTSMKVVNIFEIIVIGIVLYVIYRYIAGTQAARLLKGVIMLLLALLVSKVFKLEIVGRLLETVVNIVIFSLVVIFQPELRRLLGYLGQPGFLSKSIFNFESEAEVKNVITEIVEAVKVLSKSHTGALMVIQNTNGLESYMEIGTKLDAQISTELLLTIFHTNTPLHDGAVVINGDKIVAAGILLPLTEDPKLSWQYGTRHRAAIGMSEASDAVCLVVSEETGSISMTQGGILTKFSNIEELREELEFLYGYTVEESEKKSSSSKFSFGGVFTKEFSKFPVFTGKAEKNK